MESNNRKRLVGMLAAGLVGVLVGALVTGFVARASEEAESGVVLEDDHDPGGLTVTLHFKKPGENETKLTLRTCQAKEKGGAVKECKQVKMSDLEDVEAIYIATANIVWDGEPADSGCVEVGGVPYCW